MAAKLTWPHALHTVLSRPATITETLETWAHRSGRARIDLRMNASHAPNDSLPP